MNDVMGLRAWRLRRCLFGSRGNEGEASIGLHFIFCNPFVPALLSFALQVTGYELNYVWYRREVTVKVL